MAEKKLAKLALPRWNDLGAVYKQTIRVAYLGTHPDAVFVTINLDTVFASTGFRSKRGLALRTGDTIRFILASLGLPNSVVLNLEESHGRIKNSPFHVHGIILTPAHLRGLVLSKLRERLSADYIEHAGNKAVLIKPIRTPGRLAGYTCKDMLKALPSGNRRSYASRNLTGPSRLFYKELRNWCQQLPALQAFIRPKLPARPPQPDYPSKMQQLVAQKLGQIREQKTRRRQDNASLSRRRSKLQRLQGLDTHLH